MDFRLHFWTPAFAGATGKERLTSTWKRSRVEALSPKKDTLKSYSMHSVMGAANRAVAMACQWMRGIHPQAHIHNVQEEARFQHLGVDLLWEKDTQQIEGVEVKGDRSRGKHFFFELVSNFEKNTPGCFLYSRADWLVYVFLPLRTLYVLPLPATRAWFLPLAQTFRLQKAHTRVGPVAYTTLGVTVPVGILMRALPQVCVWRQEGEGFVPVAGPVASPTTSGSTSG